MSSPSSEWHHRSPITNYQQSRLGSHQPCPQLITLPPPYQRRWIHPTRVAPKTPIASLPNCFTLLTPVMVVLQIDLLTLFADQYKATMMVMAESCLLCHRHCSCHCRILRRFLLSYSQDWRIPPMTSIHESRAPVPIVMPTIQSLQASSFSLLSSLTLAT